MRSIKLGPKRKIAFIDRDGTLIFEPQDTFQIDNIEQLQILPGVFEGLKQLVTDGYRLVMVTNQDGLGTAKYPLQNFLDVQNALLVELAQKGVYFDRVFVCPHFPSEDCLCRKPSTTLLTDFLGQNSMDAENSLVIGDRQSDKEFAENLGIECKLMRTNTRFVVPKKRRK